jgi:hypothetical protein
VYTEAPLRTRGPAKSLFIKVSLQAVRNRKCDVCYQELVCVCVCVLCVCVCVWWFDIKGGSWSVDTAFDSFGVKHEGKTKLMNVRSPQALALFSVSKLQRVSLDSLASSFSE